MSSISSNYKDNFNVIEEQLIPESRAEIFCFGEIHGDEEGIAKISQAIKELYQPTNSVISKEGIPFGSLKVLENQPFTDLQQACINACIKKYKDLDVNMNFEGWDIENLEAEKIIDNLQKVLEVVSDPELSTISCDDDKMMEKFESLKNEDNSEIFESIESAREMLKSPEISTDQTATYREFLHSGFFAAACMEFIGVQKQLEDPFLKRNISMTNAIQEYSQKYSRIFVIAGQKHFEKMDKTEASEFQITAAQAGIDMSLKMDEAVDVVKNELKKHTYHIIFPKKEQNAGIKDSNSKQEKDLNVSNPNPKVQNENNTEMGFLSPAVLGREIFIKLNQIFNHGYCQKNRGEPVNMDQENLVKGMG